MITTCECGAKVRLPEQTRERSFRCPRCKATFATTLDAQVLSTFHSRPGDVGAMCPICQSGIAAEEVVVSCPSCGQIHHQECWVEVGGCSTYGCKETPSLVKDSAEQQTHAAWGDTKVCPVCGETIKSIALRCRYCRTEFETVDPLSRQDLKRQMKKASGRQGMQATVTVLFVLSLVGLLAPLMLPITAAWVLPKRKDLAAAGPFYLVLGYSSVILSAVYSVLMLLFWLFS